MNVEAPGVVEQQLRRKLNFAQSPNTYASKWSETKAKSKSYGRRSCRQTGSWQHRVGATAAGGVAHRNLGSARRALPGASMRSAGASAALKNVAMNRAKVHPAALLADSDARRC
jgi:hypothetical protein